MKKVNEGDIQKELNEFADKTDEEIDFSDIPATTEQDWEESTRGKFIVRAERGNTQEGLETLRSKSTD